MEKLTNTVEKQLNAITAINLLISTQILSYSKHSKEYIVKQIEIINKLEIPEDIKNECITIVQNLKIVNKEEVKDE